MRWPTISVPALDCLGRSYYAQAIAHYQAGYTLLNRIGRNHWLVNLCYDLAEVYALLWDYPAFCRSGRGRACCALYSD